MKIKTANKQVRLKMIYELAVESLDNAFTRNKAASVVNNVGTSLYRAHYQCIIIPVVNLLLFYGLLRNVQSKQDMFHYLVDLMLSLKKVTKIHLIHPPTVRGTITVDFAKNILNGLFPTEAYNKAVKDKKIESSVAWPIKNLNVSKDGSTFAFQTNKVVQQNNKKKNTRKKKFKDPNQTVQCRNCGEMVLRNRIQLHNRSFCPRNRR